MHILIIDNLTIRIEEIKALLRGHTYEVAVFFSLDLNNLDRFDFIILSGSSKLKDFNLYNSQIQLIQNTTKPLLGICFGLHLISYAFGTRRSLLNKKAHKTELIKEIQPSYLFNNLSTLFVYNAHRWAVKKAPQGFETLATSDNGVEVIKHKDKKLYGFQFHPEVKVNNNQGHKIFNNLLCKLDNFN